MTFKYNATGEYKLKENFTDENKNNEYVLENIPCINNGERIDIINEYFEFPCINIKFYMKKSIYEKINKIAKNVNIINRKLSGKLLKKLDGSDKKIYENMVNLINDYEYIVGNIIYAQDLETKTEENKLELNKMKERFIKMKEIRIKKINQKINFIDSQINERKIELENIIEEEKRLNKDFNLLKNKIEKFSSIKYFRWSKEDQEQKYRIGNNLPVLVKLNLITKKLKIVLKRKKNIKKLIKELERQKNLEKDYIKLINEQLNENLGNFNKQYDKKIKLDKKHHEENKDLEKRMNEEEQNDIKKRFDEIAKMRDSLEKELDSDNYFFDDKVVKNKININILDYSYIIVSFTFIITIIGLIIYHSLF